MTKSLQKPRRKIDITCFAGPLIALAGILGGLVLEKGRVTDLAQLTALLIVAGGTFGAVVASTPRAQLISAARRSLSLPFVAAFDCKTAAQRIMDYVLSSRRSGIAAAETEALAEADPFLRKAVLLAVDGANAAEIRAQLELAISREAERAENDACVFESAAGYAPTLGIVGAVLGLIQVMKQLDDLGQVGSGVAVAFVATLYGVGIANLLLLPAAARIRNLAVQDRARGELIREGVLSIVERHNPYLVRMRLENFLTDTPSLQKPAGAIKKVA